MELPKVNPPILVTTQNKLTEIAVSIAEEPRLAIDTESNSLFAYQERVCLLQISTPSVDYLFDPFSIQDFSPLAPIFANPAIEKIFHAAEYDIICLKRDYNFEFNNLFDTMLAARILGLTEIGLGSLLKTRFDLSLDKRFQRANWGIRPLSEAMLAYAALDTHYLFALHDQLYAELADQKLDALAEEDFKFISKVEGHSQNGNSTNCWKVAGAHHITPQQAAILDQLCRYRDDQARKADLPHFKVLPNQLLVDLCLAEITSLDDVENIAGMTPKLFRRHGEHLLEEIKKGQNATPIIKPLRPKLDKAYLDRIEALKAWRKMKGKKRKVESDVVLPKDLMESLAYHHPHTKKEMTGLFQDFPYRQRKYGKEILALLNKEEA